MTTAVTTCLKKYATFSGRAARSEFWFFYLANLIIAILGNIWTTLTNGPHAAGVAPKHTAAFWIVLAINLALTLPSWAVGVRRTHDSGKSGWFYLIPFYSFYLLAREGEGRIHNQYGPATL